MSGATDLPEQLRQQAGQAITQLAYIHLGVRDLAWWQQFAQQVGFAANADAHTMLLRTDNERDYRYVLQQSDATGVLAIGWELRSPQAFDALCRVLDARGLQVRQASRAEAATRRVEQIAMVLDPDGLRNELFWGASSALRKPWYSPTGTRFCAGAFGNSHVTMAVADAQKTLDFYLHGLGLRLSDAAWMEGHSRVYFLRCNPRHHSFAFAATPERAPATVHVMADVEGLDTLGEIRDRLLDDGFVLNRDLGSHPLDGVVSLYVATPEGFDFEIACGTRFIDEATWETDRFSRTGRPWGHRRPEKRQ
jgi:3,4-dihydroxy-9,10-secoandrosta-1,3,5(10)-triene-9,17-dione 4,5-dioxygenase